MPAKFQKITKPTSSHSTAKSFKHCETGTLSPVRYGRIVKSLAHNITQCLIKSDDPVEQNELDNIEVKRFIKLIEKFSTEELFRSFHYQLEDLLPFSESLLTFLVVNHKEKCTKEEWNTLIDKLFITKNANKNNKIRVLELLTEEERLELIKRLNAELIGSAEAKKSIFEILNYFSAKKQQSLLTCKELGLLSKSMSAILIDCLGMYPNLTTPQQKYSCWQRFLKMIFITLDDNFEHNLNKLLALDWLTIEEKKTALDNTFQKSYSHNQRLRFIAYYQKFPCFYERQEVCAWSEDIVSQIMNKTLHEQYLDLHNLHAFLESEFCKEEWKTTLINKIANEPAAMEKLLKDEVAFLKFLEYPEIIRKAKILAPHHPVLNQFIEDRYQQIMTQESIDPAHGDIAYELLTYFAETTNKIQNHHRTVKGLLSKISLSDAQKKEITTLIQHVEPLTECINHPGLAIPVPAEKLSVQTADNAVSQPEIAQNNDAKAEPVTAYTHKLLTIIDTLNKNIENKANGRWTSGKNSEKVKQLQALKKQLSANISASSQETIIHLQKIRGIAAIKRNKLHFWHTPDSVKELEQLISSKELSSLKP